MRLGVDATALIGPRTGVGHTVASVLAELVDVDAVLLGVTTRGRRALRAAMPEGARLARGPVPARAARWLWSHTHLVPVEWLCGDLDVFWGPNFLIPPTRRAATVLTIHDLAFIRHPETCAPAVLAYARTVPPMAARAHRVVAPSHAIAGEIADWLPGIADRIRVVPPGVRAVFCQPHQTVVSGLREPYAVFVGDLSRRKNVDLLLEAFGTLSGDAQLVLIGGPGPGWDEVSTRHRQLLASDRVLQPGYLPDNEVAAVVQGARVFVYPSIYEGFGIPPLEALAAGTPVITTDVAAIREAVGGSAAFVSGSSVEQLAEALAQALTGSGQADASAIQRARAATWARTAAAYRAVFEEASVA